MTHNFFIVEKDKVFKAQTVWLEMHFECSELYWSFKECLLELYSKQVCAKQTQIVITKAPVGAKKHLPTFYNMSISMKRKIKETFLTCRKNIVIKFQSFYQHAIQ